MIMCNLKIYQRNQQQRWWWCRFVAIVEMCRSNDTEEMIVDHGYLNMAVVLIVI